MLVFVWSLIIENIFQLFLKLGPLTLNFFFCALKPLFLEYFPWWTGLSDCTHSNRSTTIYIALKHRVLLHSWIRFFCIVLLQLLIVIRRFCVDEEVYELLSNLPHSFLNWTWLLHWHLPPLSLFWREHKLSSLQQTSSSFLPSPLIVLLGCSSLSHLVIYTRNLEKWKW